MIRVLLGLCVVAVLGLGVAWWLTRARPLPASAVAGLTGDPVAGERIFWAAGCASCHAAPGAKDADRLVLSGGLRLASPFGTFAVPNISPDPDHGIGTWSLADLASALKRGVSPGGQHYYPAFPYTTYTRMELQDIADLKAFLDTLPASTRANEPHDLPLPYSIRRGLGPWKMLNLSDAWDYTDPPTPRRSRAAIWSRRWDIARNATRPGIRSAGWTMAAGWAARRIPRARGASRTSPPRRSTGRPRTSPIS